ncbi:hypothetical protein BDZ97DRAFT_1919641 [Flammula alnicola]|nr:hypothetical protein BDZ97DRAFT_1919641 [Flammula alnicola]
MPSIYLTEFVKYEFELKDLERPNPNLDAVLASVNKSRDTFHASRHPYIPKSQRRIAGNKRVAQFRTTQGYRGAGRVLQSITATPGLSHWSFEELRLECYLQSSVARGCPPTAVDPVATPWAVIPPLFNAFKDEKHEEYGDDVMKD